MNIKTLEEIVNDIKATIAFSYGEEQRRCRDWPLIDFPDSYLDRVQELSKKYRSIRWLPLAVPRFELDKEEFLDWWNRESIDIVRIAPDVAEPWSKEEHPQGMDSSWYLPQFKGCDIWHYDHEVYHSRPMPWTHALKHHPMFDSIIEQIMDTLPVLHLHDVYIWESVREVYPHRDANYYWDMPTEMRIMLFDDHDPITEKTLYVADADHGDINYIDLPEDTNSFIWSNGSQLHGSHYYGKRKQLIALHCVYDLKKYERLLDSSIDQYRDQLNYKLEL